MDLIVTEKNNVARRIADILSDGSAAVREVNGVSTYAWDDRRVIGLSGHVVGVDFPHEYSDWNDVEPSALIHAEIVKRPTQKHIVDALQKLAADADRVIIATDYDREGELIGKEAYELVRGVNQSVSIDRVRFSSITENAVTEAFENPDTLDFDLAEAGEARQIVDLLWGAALTRFLSLAAKQYGEDFISVGRVQSPTLKLIVDREREIEDFDPEDYWEIFAELAKRDSEEPAFEAQYFYLDADDNEAERVWEEPDAQTVFEVLSTAPDARVTEVDRRTRTDRPPAPFNTTQFIRAAGAVGFQAKRAMSIAEDLYTAGYITYPRTDNTVYPDDLDPRELLATLANNRDFGEDAHSLLEKDDLSPTRGDSETTDHPPIHPTADMPDRGDLSEDEWAVYELVVRRFFATLADPAVWEHLRVVADVEGLSLKANGKRLVEAGYHAVYPYFNTSENYVPDVEEDETLTVADARLEDKQTQPPRRYGQSRLIETMEDLGIGTKCLTHDTKVLIRNSDGDIQRRPIGKLFDEEQVVIADGDTDIAVTETGPTMLSYDETTEELSERGQTLVSRRAIDDQERVYRVKTSTGSFSATDDHPVYVWEDGEITVNRVSELNQGDELVSARGGPAESFDCDRVVATWEDFAAVADKTTKLYGTGCNEALGTRRSDLDVSQTEFAEMFGTFHDAISRFENHQRDVPVWLLGELGMEPDELHGLNSDRTVPNPFPIQWSPALARLLANLLGDGSIHLRKEENTVDIRYHNTDLLLIDRFIADIESVFGVELSASGRPGREAHHKRKYQVQLPSALSRIVLFVLDSIQTRDGLDIPASLQPSFIGALFDDEGHISTDGKAFISNTDHTLLRTVEGQLTDLGIDARLNENQHKLYVRGRRDLERFLDTVPISADEKFFRGISRLRHYELSERKALALEHLSERALTSEELAEHLDVSVEVARNTVRELKDDGLIRTHIEGSNRSHDGNRTFRYSSNHFDNSVYATLRNHPATVVVREVAERVYDDPVYDLTIDESAPNFAVEGGAIVHNSTRHNTLDKLYDRGYVEGDPPKPTQLARGVVEAAEEFADKVVSETMTAELEADMTKIAEGEASLDDVTDESRDVLEAVFDELEASREAIGDHIREALKRDKELGPCPECGEQLMIRKSRRGSFFVGCDGYPDCEYTLPLPNKGEPLILDETCEEHDLKHVKMLAGRGTFVHGCPQCKADAADDEEDRVIGACPECDDEHGGELAIKRLRSGSRLVGCTRYPDCDYSLPLPRRGDIEVTDEICAEHDLPELIVHNGGDPWELGCPICNYLEFTGERESSDGSGSSGGNGLTAISGIGEKTAAKLRAAGVESVEDLGDADADEVAAAVDGVSADRIRDWQANA